MAEQFIFKELTHQGINTPMNGVIDLVMARLSAGAKQVVVEVKDNGYTPKQRGSLHKWCDWCADVLNESGQTCTREGLLGGAPVELKWTGTLFKETVYKPILEAMTGLKSTEDQTTVQPSEVAQVISKRYADNGLQCPPWPSAR